MAWIIAASIIAASIIVATALNNAFKDRGYDGREVSRPADMGGSAGTAGSTSGASGSVSLSEAQIRAKYAERTIQFDESCQARPNAPVYKIGQNFLLDNRSEVTRVISFAGHQYTVPGYGYVVVSLSSATTPKAYNIDCDLQQNVSTVTVQK